MDGAMLQIVDQVGDRMLQVVSRLTIQTKPIVQVM